MLVPQGTTTSTCSAIPSFIGCKGLVTRTLDSMVHNPVFEVAVSVDQAGILEYWAGPKLKYNFPKCVTFDSKLDTDLFEFAKAKTFPTGLCFSPDGKRFATLSADRKISKKQTLNLTGVLLRSSLVSLLGDDITNRSDPIVEGLKLPK
uniref:Uncharacterized protein n=1 Tax=Timema cristinae TaxID=61476 RepID=A0A7R9HDG2_TIMCR|nr:unnamed protein product [Timema cristinae]